MSFIDSITPKETEEVKPGLFIQKTSKGYRQIHPAAWQGKVNWKNFFWGSGFTRSFIWFAIILLVVFGYQDSTTSCSEFQENPCPHLKSLQQYCLDIDFQGESIDSNIIKDDDGKREDFNPVQSNP